MNDGFATIVMPDSTPPAPKPAAPRAALARLAFGSVPSSVAAHTLGPRHLAFLPPESLELDLNDPAQRTFGDYELIDKLGQGGMGVVYRARQRSLEREVALKLLSAGPWASKDFIERFRREAQSAARMQHPNIVAIYEIGAHDELNFFSMRLVQGVSLAHQLQESGPLPPKRAAQLMRAIAEALDYAHRLGVLHLDLKPANVLIDERGEPQVADFGLARRLDETLTRDNDEVSGTPSYMAPEQAQIKSHKLSQATDIYGLGAILYELLTGRPPFLGSTPQDTLQRVISEAPTALRQLQPTLPVDLEAICLKCLAKEPGERYSSARALAEDLGRFVEGRQVSVRPLNAAQRAARWARREPRLAASVAVAALALIVGLIATTTQWRRADHNADDARHTLRSMRSQAAQAALVAGDGFRGLRPLVQNLMELEAEGRTEDAAVERQRIGTVLANAPQLVDLFRFPQGTIVSSVAIAPDGKHFALATHGGRGQRRVRQYDLDGRELWSTATDGLTHVLPFDGMQHGPIRYTKDGSRIVVLLAQAAVIPAPTVSDAIALDARNGHVLAPPAELGHADIVWDGDARQALLRFRSDPSTRFPDSGQLFDAETWQPLGPRLPHGTAIGADEWLWSPDGKRLLGSSDFTRFTLFEPATLKPQLQFELPRGDPVRAWRFTPDGGQLALGTLTGTVYLVDTRDGSRASLPSAPTATVRWLEFSADGHTLVAQAENNAIVSWDVPTRRARAAPTSMSGTPWNSRVLPVGDTLYSAVGDQLVSWSLAPHAPFDNVAVPGAARLRSPRAYLADGFDVHDPSRLMIVAGSDGMVGLWRLPRPALLGARAAPLPTRYLGFDGERIVAVDGATVVLRDALTQAPRSRAFVHPENVRLAELSHDGKALVTVAGRTVRVLDLASGELRGAPIVLPETPVRADIASAAPVLALTTSGYVGDTYQERIHVIDLEHGSLRPGELTLEPGYVAGFELEPRGRYVLVSRWTPPEGENMAVAAVDLESGKARCENMGGNPGEKQVADTAIARDGETAWTYALQSDRLVQFQRWRLKDCVALTTIQVPGTGGAVKLMPLGDGVVAHRMISDKLVVFDAAGGRHETPGAARDGSMFEFALSHDGRRAAVASRSAVQIVDLARGERSSAPLPAPIPGNDAIAKLAFSPDGTQLVGRTIQGRWLHWNVPESRQATAELGEMAALLDRTGSEEPMNDEALTALRRRLRAADPGADAESGASQPEPVTLEMAEGAEPSPRFAPLDLGPALNVPLNGAWPLQAATGGDLPTLALGAQRLLDVDWRVDGGVQLSRGGPATTIHPTQHESPLVPVPMLQVRRVHVLTLMHIPVPRSAPSKQFARVVLIGVDGRETPLEIRTIRDVATHAIPERAAPSARVAYLGIGTGDVRGGGQTSSQTVSAVFSVGLDVPPGIGTIKALRLEAGDGPMEVPLFYAVTFELDEVDPARPGMHAAR